MRVVLINSRPDALKNPGGDSVQLLKTRLELEKIGVEVEERGLEHLDELQSFDLAHVFNIQMPESAVETFDAIEKQKIPIALSPIYWDVYDLWFEAAAEERVFWRVLTSITGRRFASRSYVKWQRRKAPGTLTWQLQRQLIERANLVLPNSQSEVIQIRNEFKLGDDFITKNCVIPNGIDYDIYKELPEPSQAFVKQYGVKDFILQVGTLNPVKNQLGMLKSLYDLSLPIVIIGQTMTAYQGYADECKAIGARRGHVTFIDHVPHGQLPGIYALASVHVLPSWRETPGLVSLEAAATGCPIVTTSRGSTRDYFGNLAYYCDPYHSRSIRNAVETALSHPKSLELRSRVLREFTWRRAAEETRNAYHKVLGRKV